jgi:DNA-binding beta-propeller fold protein YncE
VPAVSPDGSHLYLANFGSDTISVYAIGGDGALTPQGAPAPTQDGPSQLSFTPDGKYLYAPNFGSGSVSAFAVGADGGLTAVPGSPFPVGGTFPANSEVTPDGKALYVSRRMGNSIAGFAIAPNGALSTLPGSPYASSSPEGMAFTPDGTTMYAASFGINLLSTYSRAANGALTSGPTTPVGVGPTAVETAFGGDVLYVVNASTASVTSFTVGAGGVLAPAGPAVPTGGVAPSGRSVAVVETDDKASLKLKAKKKQKLRGKVKIVAKLSSDESLDVRLTGVAKAKGAKQAKLKPRTLGLIADEPLKVTLKAKRKGAARSLLDALADGAKGKAKLKASATDDLGNKAKAKAKVKLKAKG